MIAIHTLEQTPIQWEYPLKKLRVKISIRTFMRIKQTKTVSERTVKEIDVNDEPCEEADYVEKWKPKTIILEEKDTKTITKEIEPEEKDTKQMDDYSLDQNIVLNEKTEYDADEIIKKETGAFDEEAIPIEHVVVDNTDTDDAATKITVEENDTIHLPSVMPKEFHPRYLSD